MSAFLFALCLTLIIETPFSFLLKGKRTTGLFVAFITNVISNPIFNAIYAYAFGYSQLFFYLGEAAIILIEGLVYFLYSRSRWGFGISALANILSAGVGYELNQLSLPMDLALLICAAILLLELPLLFIIAYRLDKGKRQR